MNKFRKKEKRNWGKPWGDVPNTPTSFDDMVQSLKLTEKDYQNSIPLREWAQKHKDSKYVPQRLLEAWGIEVNV
jgi:hypothetical protein